MAFAPNDPGPAAAPHSPIFGGHFVMPPFTPPPPQLPPGGVIPPAPGGGVVPPRYTPPAGYVNAPGATAGLTGGGHPFGVPPHQTPPSQNPQDPYFSDPGYQAALAQEQMGLGQLDAALKAARERALIDFGDPSMASMAGFGLDPQAAAFARQNYLSGNSQLSRLDKSHDLARQAVINQLASHGILASGDLGYKEGIVNQGYGNDLYDAKQRLLDYLNGVGTQDLQSRQQLHSGVVSAIQQAYQNFLNHPELYPNYPGDNANGAATAGNAGAVAAGHPSGGLIKAAGAGVGAHPTGTPRERGDARFTLHKVLNAYTTGQKRFG